jgi:hypothetical protein
MSVVESFNEKKYSWNFWMSISKVSSESRSVLNHLENVRSSLCARKSIKCQCGWAGFTWLLDWSHANEKRMRRRRRRKTALLSSLFELPAMCSLRSGPIERRCLVTNDSRQPTMMMKLDFKLIFSVSSSDDGDDVLVESFCVFAI